MTQSALKGTTHFPGLHVGIIMDGNGRWATARALPRVAGHRQGAESVRTVVEAAPSLGIGTLTLYAFSADNWQRPPREVRALMALFRSYLRGEVARLVENGVRLSVIGRRDRLALSIRTAIAAAEQATARGRTLHLRLAIDYSARDAIIRAAARLEGDATAAPTTASTRDAFARALAHACGTSIVAPDVDLLVRTGGEQRLSDFLLWECAYAELYFTDRMWPEFSRDDFARALEAFHARERRFGAVPTAAAG